MTHQPSDKQTKPDSDAGLVDEVEWARQFLGSLADRIEAQRLEIERLTSALTEARP